jgi:hypothetical protein
LLRAGIAMGNCVGQLTFQLGDAFLGVVLFHR